jgi:hypothetical protein
VLLSLQPVEGLNCTGKRAGERERDGEGRRFKERERERERERESSEERGTVWTHWMR